MKRMERGGKAVEEEGVSWVVLVVYWKRKEQVRHRLFVLIVTTTNDSTFAKLQENYT